MSKQEKEEGFFCALRVPEREVSMMVAHDS